MAKIRILQAVAGLDFSWTPGEEVELPDDEAAKWADGERAELVTTSSREQPERAAKRSRGGGRAERAETRD